MIPRSNADGYLPKGIHKATLNEIKERFGNSSLERKELFEGLQSLARLLHKHKKSIKRFLLNGSFVTSSESPKDFDCILIVRMGFDFGSPEVKKLLAAKKLFGAHLFIFTEKDVSRYHRLVDFFGHDRDQKPKGLVEVVV